MLMSPKLSPTNRSHGVYYEPGPHTVLMSTVLTNRGQMGIRPLSTAPEKRNDQGFCPGHPVSEGGLEPPRPLVGH